MTKDEKLASARELKKTSEGLIAGYLIGLAIASLVVMGGPIVFGVFASIFLGLFAIILTSTTSMLTGLEAEDD